MIQLLVTADDCGMAHGINYVTADYHLRGIINSASIMTNFGEITDHAFEHLAQYDTLELGMHLNLSDGNALTQPMRDFNWMRGSKRRVLDRLQWFTQLFASEDEQLKTLVYDELKAQIEAFLATGYSPTNLTTHGHFQVIPLLRDIVYQLAQEYEIRWVRAHDVGQSVVPMNVALKTDFLASETPSGVRTPNYLLPIMAWLPFPPAQCVDDLLKLEGIVEIVVHPSPPNDITFPKDAGYTPSERAREVRYLDKVFDLLQPYLGSTVELATSSGWQPV